MNTRAKRLVEVTLTVIGRWVISDQCSTEGYPVQDCLYTFIANAETCSGINQWAVMMIEVKWNLKDMLLRHPVKWFWTSRSIITNNTRAIQWINAGMQISGFIHPRTDLVSTEWWTRTFYMVPCFGSKMSYRLNEEQSISRLKPKPNGFPCRGNNAKKRTYFTHDEAASL